MDARQRLLSEHNYTCPNCNNRVTSSNNAVCIPAYKHRDCNDTSSPLTQMTIDHIKEKIDKKEQDFFDSLEIEE